MNRSRITAVMVGLALVLAVPLAESVLYTVNERELAVLLQFGQPVASRTKPGLYFKLPLIQEVMRLPKTLQVWHGTSQMKSSWTSPPPTARRSRSRSGPSGRSPIRPSSSGRSARSAMPSRGSRSSSGAPRATRSPPTTWPRSSGARTAR